MVLLFFDKNEIERIGRISNFIKRKSKLTAYRFLLTLIFSRFDSDQLSLNDLCNELDDKFRCLITKQSIDERFNPDTVNFMKMVIERSINKKIVSKNTIPFLNNFTAIKIQDSTSFQIPKNLSGYYGGCGGATTGALARIQFEYDLKNMNMTTLELTSGSYPDVTYSKDNVASIKKGELIIRDLSYISGAFLRDVIKQDAFFINRLRSRQTVFIKDSKGNISNMDFSELLRKMNRNKQHSIELNIFLKVNKEFVGMRLVVEKMPDEIYANRIRKAEKEAKKQKRKLTKESKTRAWFNLFITNIEGNTLKSKDIGYIYSIRWQIELIFKSWKSTFNIAKIKKVKKERFECQLYGRLLLIILSWEIYSATNNAIILSGKLMSPQIISYYKFNKIMCARLESFMLALIYRGIWLDRFLSRLTRRTISKTQNIEPKNKTISVIHIFEMIAECPDRLPVRVSDVS